MCDDVLSLLSEFSSISGQMRNHQKSFVKFSPNTPPDYRDYLASSLRLTQKTSLGPYLGVPVDLVRSKCSAFYDLVDKIARRIANFTSLRLSSATKLVVINSVLIASITHVLSVFKVSQTICDCIDQLCLRFWWRTKPRIQGNCLSLSLVVSSSKGYGRAGN